MLPNFDICRSEFRNYNIKLDKDKYDKFDKYANFLVQYNKKINLTTITNPFDIMLKHFIDSSLIIKYIELPLYSTVIDIGTGAGFPSIPLKIIRPDLKVTLLDCLTKRINFLKKLCSILNIIDVEFIHGRAENIAKISKYREVFDIACARAVANLSILSEYCIPFVKIGGLFLSMKGSNENIFDSKNAVTVLGCEINNIYKYKLNFDIRKIIEIKKKFQTPAKYPRNSSQIKKKSL